MTSHAFGNGAPFSIGLEEELLLVDAETQRLAHVAEEVLPRIDLPPGRVDHEAFASELELRSEPSAATAAAVGQLREAREAARAAGATLMASGLHPDAELGDVRLVRSERYERVERGMRGLITRTPECALHVHVGVPEPDAAAHALTGLRELLPLVQGLGASSPFWFGRDSGLASARSAVVRAYPGRGVPPVLGDYGDYERALHEIAAGGGPSDYTMIWWDVRLQPRLGTVELRELDVQARLEDTAAIAALVRAAAARAAEQPLERPSPGPALAWSWFLAARDGVETQILHDGRLVPLTEAARVTVSELRPIARELGDEDALEGIERILADPAPGRRRRSHAGGGMPALLRQVIEETGG